MLIIGQKFDAQNISYTLAQFGADRFAVIVRDEDVEQLIMRYNGNEDVMRSRYAKLCEKAEAK